MATLKVDDIQLERYGISMKTGFLIESPLQALPEYFEPWNRLSKAMPKYVEAKIMRREVLKMPLLDESRLVDEREKRLAHLQLCIIGSGYVWQGGDDGVPKSIPACLAVPWHKLSIRLGIQPILSHPGFCLANWKLIDLDKPLSLTNIRSLYNVPGGMECDWFVVVTCAIELEFTKAFQPILEVLGGAEVNDTSMVLSGLEKLTVIIQSLQDILSKMHDKLSSDTFFNTIRPYLSGWGGETNPLPDGMIYEGIQDNIPLQMTGGSAAQSATLQLLDAVLGVEHAQDKKDFLDNMRKYMMPIHRKLIIDIEGLPNNAHSYVESCGDDNLKQAYNTCLTALTKFRSYHINIVIKYIVIASKKNTDVNRFKSLAEKGTGGTSLLPFLKELRSDTEEAVLKE